jgi:hypothetical protein
MIWPSLHGDHRGARRGRGPGAARGRVRWQWTAAHGIGAVLVGGERIYAQTGPALHVLDATGAEVARSVPAPEAARLIALVAEALIVRTASGVAALDATGALRWEHAVTHPLRAVAIGPEGEVYLWTLDASHPLRKHGTLTRLSPDGRVEWTQPHAITLAGYVLGMELACDDGGVLYTLCRARLGDGVSGGDVSVGGVAAYDATGCRWVRRSDAREHLDHVHGLAAGALCRGHATVGFTRDGELAWESRALDAPLVEVDGLEGGLRVEPRLAMAPERLLDPGPDRAKTSLACTFDDAGNTYFGRLLWGPPRVDRLFSLDPDHRLRWRLDVPPVPFAFEAPIIGPDATVLLSQQATLTAIE